MRSPEPFHKGVRIALQSIGEALLIAGVYWFARYVLGTYIGMGGVTTAGVVLVVIFVLAYTFFTVAHRREQERNKHGR